MRIASRSALAALGLILASFSGRAHAQTTAREQVRTAEERMHDAYVRRDTALFASLYADDATFTYSTGEVVGKAERVKRFTRAFAGLQDSVQKIRVYGDVAVVNCLSTYANGDKTKVVAIQITRVWRKRGDRWQVIAFQSTPTSTPQGSNVRQAERITFVEP